MTLQSWLLVATAIVVGIPAVWMTVRAIKGPPHATPTHWCELPATASAGFHVVVAVSAPIEDTPPREPQDLRAISVAARGKPVGMALAPGTYWLYAVPARGQVGMLEAVDTVFRAIRADPSTLLPIGARPTIVSPPGR